MAWSWSHTANAYDAARQNLEAMPLEKLEVIFAEWRAAQGKGGIIHDSDSFNEKKYNRALAHAKSLSKLGTGFAHEQLVEFIWEKASEAATCDNGGFLAWMCPSGCGCHCVSFSLPEEEEEDDPEDFSELEAMMG